MAREYWNDLANAPVEVVRTVVDMIADTNDAIETGDLDSDERQYLEVPEDAYALSIRRSDEEASWTHKIFVNAPGGEPEGPEDAGHYGGPGRGFSNPMTCQRFGDWLVFSQSGGLDI